MSTRKNPRWRHARLRRLDAKIKSSEKKSISALFYADSSPQSIQRCRQRRSQILDGFTP